MAACSAAATSTTPSCAQHGIEPIDLLVVNLYPFAATDREAGLHATRTRSRTSTSAALRWCARRRRITTASRSSSTRPTTRRCWTSWRATAGAIVGSDAQASGREGVRAHGQLRRRGRSLLSARVNEGAGEFPRNRSTLNFQKRIDLRYGENPHQSAAFYRVAGRAGRQHRRREAAAGQAALVQQHRRRRHRASNACGSLRIPACVIVKHANPCGVAVASDTLAAYDRAYQTDPTSAFGGIIAFNRALDGRHRDARSSSASSSS